MLWCLASMRWELQKLVGSVRDSRFGGTLTRTCNKSKPQRSGDCAGPPRPTTEMAGLHGYWSPGSRDIDEVGQVSGYHEDLLKTLPEVHTNRGHQKHGQLKQTDPMLGV